MTKELQDLAWSVLPKEFKEEVRTIYAATLRMVDKRKNAEQIYINKLTTLEGVFGLHILTSDAEKEDDEMLYVSRKKMHEKWQRAYENESKYAKAEQNPTIYAELYYNRGILSILDTLFGSKCLPDEETITQFKFKVGDKVIFHPFKSDSFYNAEVLEICDMKDKPYLLHLEDAENIWAYSIEVQSIAETYPQEPKPAESEEDKAEAIASKAIKPVEEHFDTILKRQLLKRAETEYSGDAYGRATRIRQG